MAGEVKYFCDRQAPPRIGHAGRSLWQVPVPLVSAMFAAPDLGPVKTVLAAQGRIENELRAPMTRASEALHLRLKQLAAV